MPQSQFIPSDIEWWMFSGAAIIVLLIFAWSYAH